MMLFVSFSFAANSPADEWPVFRGPQANGHAEAKGLSQHWSSSENVLWKQSVPGKGWSTPVIAKGRVYLTTAVPGENGAKSDYSLRLVALDAVSGKPIFDKEVFEEDGTTSPGIHRKN